MLVLCYLMYFCLPVGPLSEYLKKPSADAQKDECLHAYVSRKTAGSNKRQRK
jgi:hypothetical protein